MTFLTMRNLMLVLSLSVFFSTGCGGESYEVPTLVEVTGTVNMDGAPLSNASVIFTPQQGTAGMGAFGVTDANGTYSLQHKSGNPGVETGKYYVTFSKFAMPDGSPIPEGKTAADVMAKEFVPEKYRTVTELGPKNIAEVKTSGDTFDFELKSK